MYSYKKFLGLSPLARKAMYEGVSRTINTIPLLGLLMLLVDAGAGETYPILLKVLLAFVVALTAWGTFLVLNSIRLQYGYRKAQEYPGALIIEDGPLHDPKLTLVLPPEFDVERWMVAAFHQVRHK